MRSIQLVLGMYQTNCYILTENDRTCVLIDPAGDEKKLLHQLETRNLTPEAILLTHGHYDHILAIPAIQSRWSDVPVYCHTADCPEELTERDMGQVFPTVSAFQNLRPLQDSQVIHAADMSIKVLTTPGHTPGSVTFQVAGALYTGDTLFYLSIGRTDFAGGSYPQIQDSLNKLSALPGDYHVFSGHGPATSLEFERRNNPYMKEAIR